LVKQSTVTAAIAVGAGIGSLYIMAIPEKISKRQFGAHLTAFAKNHPVGSGLIVGGTTYLLLPPVISALRKG
jgi:hypothetical protein